MSSIPPDDEEDEAPDDFLRELARVEDRAPPPPSVRVEGTLIGRYEVVSEIGRGGMGIVFLAEDAKLGRKVALKLLPPSFAADEERRRRFLREARAAAAVSHPNLVTLYDVGEHEGRAYIAMEYLPGRSLREVLVAKRLSVDEAVDIARQVLAGLVHAHAAGLLHRDLKPENVLLGDDGRVRILDFGLAKLDRESEPGDNTTRDGLVMGTPGYMSPEQARGQSLDARSDVFSFGVLLHELLTGKRPFDGPTRADVVTSLLRDPSPRADALRPEVGPALADFGQRCLAKAPSDRLASAALALAALDQAWSSTKERRSGDAQLATNGAPTRPKTPRVTMGIRWAAAGLGVAALAAALAFPSSRTRPAVVSVDSGAQKAKAIAITDVPAPASKSPEALVAYKQALQAVRDADWGIATERLTDATARDPELAPAHLRHAILAYGGGDGPSIARDHLARAMAMRGTLSERDQKLLFAFEPTISRDPAETALARQRLRALAQAYPDDAEIWHFYAMFGTSDEDETIAASRHATELDPQFADSWQVLAEGLAWKGRTDEALAAIERCVTISPLTADCRGERARIYGVMGECSRMEEDLRRGLSSNPRAANIWHEDRAAALLAVGRTDDTVVEAFRQKWSLLGADKRKGVEPYDRALLAAVRGRFEEADALLALGEKAVELDPNAQVHARFATFRVAIAHELGKTKDAAKIAERYITKRDVWLGSESAMDMEIPMLRVMQHGGLLTADDFVKRRDTWYARVRAADSDKNAVFAWHTAYTTFVQTPAEAKDALAHAPTIDMHRLGKDGGVRADVGFAYLLAGRPDDALIPLETAAKACNWLRWPVSHTKALLHLGQAHEQLGHTEAACAAYQRVVSRWGSARTSATRDVARARSDALACKSLSLPSSSSSSPASAPKTTKRAKQDPDDDDDDDDEIRIPVPHLPNMPPMPKLPPVAGEPPSFGALPKPPRPAGPRPHDDDRDSTVVVRRASARGALRDGACKQAKQAALERSACGTRPKSVEGDCVCTPMQDGWKCVAAMAVVCD